MCIRKPFLALVAALCCTLSQAAISVGSNAVSAVYYGTNAVSAVYSGSNLVWSSAPVMIPEDPSDWYTYTDVGDEVRITGLVGVHPVLNIPEFIGGKPVGYIGVEFSMAFNSSLTDVTLPATVHNIYYGNFYNDSNLVSVRFKGNAPALGPYIFNGVNSSCVIYRTASATGFGTPPDSFGGLPTAYWTP